MGGSFGCVPIYLLYSGGYLGRQIGKVRGYLVTFG